MTQPRDRHPVQRMPARLRAAGTAIALLILASCSAQQPTVRQPPAPASSPAPRPEVPASAETPPATLGCDPAPVQSMLGKVTSPALQLRARDAAGAEIVRRLSPGQATTREYRAGRLNLQVDTDGRLQRAFCG